MLTGRVKKFSYLLSISIPNCAKKKKNLIFLEIEGRTGMMTPNLAKE